MPRIRAGADEVFTLLDDAGRVVACVRGASIRVGAFASEDAAVDAALRGDRIVAAQLGAVRASTAAHRAADVELLHDGAYEWIVCERRPLARLIRPGAPIAHGDALHRAAFALEFVMPTAVPIPARLTITQALHRTFAARGRTHDGASPAHRARGGAPTDPTPPAAA